MVIHGEKDELVPVDQAWKIFDGQIEVVMRIGFVDPEGDSSPWRPLSVQR